MLHRRALLALALALALSAPAASLATTTVAVTVEELARQSDDVALVRVLQRSSRWEGRFIVTDHEVEVLAVSRGALREGSRVVVRLAGGAVGRVAQVIPDAPEMVPGGNYLVFLRGGADGARFVSHMTAAVVPVTVRADRSGLDATVPPTLLTTGPRTGAPEALDPILARVRGAAR